MAEQSKNFDTIKSKLIQANTDTTSTAGRTAIAKILQNFTTVK